MQINELPMSASMPMDARPMDAASMPSSDDMSKSLESQMFDQLVAQSMSEMQKRQAEIKESLEKSNEEQG